MADYQYPESRVEGESALCDLGMRPQIITGALVNLLRTHFCEANNIEYPTLRNLIWRAPAYHNVDANEDFYDKAPTDIVIDPINLYDPKAVEKRPAIYVRRDTWTTKTLGINDQYMGHFGDLACDDGSEEYESGIMGSHTIFCLASEAAAAEILGFEVWYYFLQLSSKIREELHLSRFKTGDLNSVVELKTEGHTNWFVPVVVTYFGTHTWVLEPDANILKYLSIAPETT